MTFPAAASATFVHTINSKAFLGTWKLTIIIIIKNQNWEQPGMSLLACTYVLGSLYVIVAVKWFICNAVSIYSIAAAVDQNLLEYCFSEKKCIVAIFAQFPRPWNWILNS